MTDDNTTTTTTATTTTTKAMVQCPYAVALSEDEASHSSTGGARKVRILTAELSQCPAFAAAMSSNTQDNNTNNTNTNSNKPKCPFQGATSPEQVQQTLAQIPKSHYTEHQSSFFQVMQHMHSVHEKGTSGGGTAMDPKYFRAFGGTTLGGGQCPMQPYVAAATNNNNSHSNNSNNNNNRPRKSFARVMEDCSMAAIMARLAADMEDGGDDSHNSGGEDDSMTPRNSDAALRMTSPLEDQQVKALDKDDTGATGNNNNNNTQTDTTTEEPLPPRNSLAEALKAGTAVSHQAAEDVHFVKNFISGKIDRHLYQEMILGLYHVYVALEDALDQHASTVFPSCHFPDELRRRQALEDDVEFWHNTRSPSARTISPATKDYMHRIQYLAQHDPLLLLAHSYTRYLGDLSGGRILARVARKSLDLDKESGEGLAFYRFDKVQSYKAFKDNYRHALDALPLTSPQIQALVAEANVAFCFNMRLFQELDVMATIPGARVMSLEEVMKYADQGSSSAGPPPAAGEDQCPFLVNKKKEQQQQLSAGGMVKKEGARCPWPFVFAHDPVQGILDWQTWGVVALIVAW